MSEVTTIKGKTLSELCEYCHGIAKEKGFILNEYGLYPIDKHNKYTDVGFQINSEKDIFDRLDDMYRMSMREKSDLRLIKLYLEEV